MLVTQLREDTLDMNRVEVIEASRALESPLYPVLSSFANRRGGGIILFGLQGPKCSASGIYDVDDLQQLVLLQGRQMSPEVHPCAHVPGSTGTMCSVWRSRSVPSIRSPATIWEPAESMVPISA